MFKTCGRKVPSALGNGTECIGGCGIFIYILHHEELKQVGVGGSKKTCADHFVLVQFQLSSFANDRRERIVFEVVSAKLKLTNNFAGASTLLCRTKNILTCGGQIPSAPALNALAGPTYALPERSQKN